ncbi:MAG: BlaI/MecI/CopY family transcriptional regulator [Clostridiales bacterium]|jgi:BlaI family penicillinase repressor|nr:BlaI/MecI/CopY family transcriptional regulator [Clostridiales bacterium]
MSSRSKELGSLSETEMSVMRTIWGLENPVTVQQVLGIYQKSKGWKTSTLSTILKRLIEKGFLTKNMVGKVNYYSYLVTEEDYKKHETASFLASVHKGSIKSFMAALADVDGIEVKEVAELKKWFQEKAGDD